MNPVLVLDLILLPLVVLVAIATVFMRDLLASAAMLAIYSLLLSLVWANMYALDVAFTEAAVGAGISTILLIATLVVTGTREKVTHAIHWPALLLVLGTGAALGYGTRDMPAFGDAASPVHTHLHDAYTNQNVGKPGLAAEPVTGDDSSSGDFGHHAPNLVTAVLANYRGYDTLFETAVIFTAGISVILLLRRREVQLLRPFGTADGFGSGGTNTGDGEVAP